MLTELHEESTESRLLYMRKDENRSEIEVVDGEFFL